MTAEIKKAKLAINGGKPAKTVPYTKGKRFDETEEKAVLEPLRAQKLWYKQGGTKVLAAEKTFAEMWGIKHAITVSSGTAAVHTALVMCGVEAGDEVIVNPITDWGSVCGILALNAVPVFCDISLDTYSLDPACVEKAVTKKTRAVVLVHIGGYPAQVKEIIKIAVKHNIKVIEDCAQSHYARLDKKIVGTFGDGGAFAVSDAKHISCGEGGVVITNDDDMAETAFRFRDKGYAKDKIRGTGDTTFLGFNYRMAELNAAVLNVQLRKLPSIVERRRDYVNTLKAHLGEVNGLVLLEELPGAESSYWFMLSHLDLNVFKVGRQEISDALAAEGLAFWPALAPARTLYHCTSIREGRLYPYNRTGTSVFLKGRTYDPADFPKAEMLADSAIGFLCSEFYTEQDARETAEGIKKVMGYYKR